MEALFWIILFFAFAVLIELFWSKKHQLNFYSLEEALSNICHGLGQTILNIGPGGLSGQPIFLRSQKVVEYIHKKTSGKIPIIAVGGISTTSDAIKMFNSGASLIQIYTAFIYEGPSFIRRINKKLLSI